MDYREDPDPFCRSCEAWRVAYERVCRERDAARRAARRWKAGASRYRSRALVATMLVRALQKGKL